MGYVGTAPLSGNYTKLDDISSSFNGSTTDFTLQVSSANVTPPKETTVLISVGGILQEPVTAYTIASSTISFTSAPASGADFFGVMLGSTGDIGTPSDDTVTGAKIVDNAIDSEHYTDGSIDTAHLAADAVTGAKIADNAIDSEHYTDGSIDNAHIADDAIDSEHYAAGSIDTAHIADDQITLAKMAGGTDGNVISYDASGDPVAIATGNDGQVLTSTGAGSPPAFEDISGGIAMIDQWDVNVAPGSATGWSQDPLVSWVQTTHDGAAYNIGAQMSESSGVFTFPSTGVYQVSINYGYVTASSTADNQFQVQIQTSLNAGTDWDVAAYANAGIFSTTAGQNVEVHWIYDVTNTTNRLIRFSVVDCASGTYGSGSGTGGPSASFATFIRLSDT